jgi:hypothetical protein
MICDVCEIIKGCMGGYRSKEYIIDLPGGWVLNHYGNPESVYVGYLVLSTKEHETGWNKISSDNLKYLGLNINWIDTNLKDCWMEIFDEDPIDQIYFAYFNDSAFINQIKSKEYNIFNSLHVHLHIQPRTKKMLRICNGDNLAFDLLKLRNRFPPEYIYDYHDNRKIKLLNHLKNKAKDLANDHE